MFSGGFLSVLAQMRPPSPKWTAENMPDLAGKVIIVTGGNTGLGKETIKALLQHNAKVYLAARSKDKAEEAIRELKQITRKEAIFLHLDLGSIASVKASAQEFLSKEPELHVLFNNAGVMMPPVDQVTSDGFDLQWGTNVVGHWLFTKLLIPALLRGAESSPDRKARIVTTSASAIYVAKMNYATFKDGPARRKSDTLDLYSQSKFGNVVVAKEFARRYGDQGLVSISLNPGNIHSDLQRHWGPVFGKVMKTILHPTWYGAITQLYAGAAPEAASMNGKWLIPWARVGVAHPKTQDPEVGRKLWKWLEENVDGKST